MVLDHHISLSYMTSAEVQRVGETLRSDPSETRNGWYLRAYSNEGYNHIVKLTYVPAEVVQFIAGDIEDHLADAGIKTNLATAVLVANIEHRERRKRGMKLLRERIAADSEALKRMETEDAA